MTQPGQTKPPATHPEQPQPAPSSVTDEDHVFDTDERAAVGEPEPAVRRARVSWGSVIGLLLGAVGVLTALTGALYPVAVVAGGLGLLFSLAGLVATRKPHVASRALAIVALLVSLGALALAAMAYSDRFDWLAREDQAGWLRQWLDDRVPGLDRW